MHFQKAEWSVTVCYRTDLFWSASEGQLGAQKVARCSHTRGLAGKATGSSLCWSMSLEHFLCLLVGWIFHKFRIKRAVPYSTDLPAHATMGKYLYSDPLLLPRLKITYFKPPCVHVTFGSVCFWLWQTDQKRERKKRRKELLYLQQLIASFVSRGSFLFDVVRSRILRMEWYNGVQSHYFQSYWYTAYW